ncbi:hypothetical protein MKX03_020647, partial [Papaver bracteatum]
GYFREGRKGGHGVIIRENRGKPIVASAVTSTEAISFLYLQLQGVARGFELVVEYSLLDISIFCNSKHVSRLVNRVLGTMTGCTMHSDEENSFDLICKMCVKGYAEEDYPLIFPLLRRIAELVPNIIVPLNLTKCARERNKAADYLAKNGAHSMELLHPCDFPDDLKEILCKDYFASHIYGLPALL